MNEENNNVQRDTLVFVNNFNGNNESSNSNKNTDKNKKPNVNIGKILVIILVFVIIIGLIIFFVSKKPDKKSDDSKIIVEDMFEYSGTYKLGDTIVTMNVVDEKHVIVNINKDGDYKTINFKTDKNNNLIPDDESFENSDKITIEKTKNGINIKSSSNDPNSVLNDVNGSFKEENFKSKDWAGIYKKGNTKIAIDQYAKDRITINITQGELSYETEVYNITDTKLIIENVRFMINEDIKIEKKSNSIVVESKSGDPDSILNKINGEYSKIK